jgi:hypothetical protein
MERWMTSEVKQDITSYTCGYKDGEYDGYLLATYDLKPIVSAAIKTLKDNLHLCDGDICTLKELRDAVNEIFPDWEKDK